MRKNKNDDERPSFLHTTPNIQKEHPVPDYVKKVDDFVERYYNGDYVVDTTRAFKIPYSIERQESTLGHWLTFLVSEYEVSKTKTFRDRYWCANWLLQLITHAFAVNVIKKGEGLITKLKECKEQNKQLTEEYEKLVEKYLKLKSENEELHKFLDTINGRGTIEE